MTLNASSCITILGRRTEQLYIIAGFLPRHWLYKWFSQFHSCSWSPSIVTSCSVLPPEIVMQDAFNVILWMSTDICVVHDDLRWKNGTTLYNCRFSATSLALRVIFICRMSADICVVCDDLGWKNRTRYNCRFSSASLVLQVILSGGTTEQHVIIAGFLLRHWFYKWFYRAEQPSNTL